MNLFETVKACVPVPDAAKRYGIRADRHGMALCPFHEDRHPSLKLNPVYYYCYGCGATGDVTDFVSRLFSLRPYDAAKKLAEDMAQDDDFRIKFYIKYLSKEGYLFPRIVVSAYNRGDLSYGELCQTLNMKSKHISSIERAVML